MKMRLLAITLLFLLELGLGQADTCKVGSSHQHARNAQCPRGGCAVLQYKNLGRHQEYKCLNDLRHPAIDLLPCEYSTVDATCYDQYSTDMLPLTVQKLQTRERTYGEVLRDLGIERFCCCRGSLCNAANSQILQFFNVDSRSPQGRYSEDDFPRRPGHQQGRFPEDEFPRRPGQQQEPRVWEDDFPKRPGHRHDHGQNAASSFVDLYGAFFSSTLLYAVVRLIF